MCCCAYLNTNLGEHKVFKTWLGMYAYIFYFFSFRVKVWMRAGLKYVFKYIHTYIHNYIHTCISSKWSALIYIYLHVYDFASIILPHSKASHFRSLFTAWIIYSLLGIRKHTPSIQIGWLSLISKKENYFNKCDTFRIKISELKQGYKLMCCNNVYHSFHPLWYEPFQGREFLFDQLGDWIN